MWKILELVVLTTATLYCTAKETPQDTSVNLKLRREINGNSSNENSTINIGGVTKIRVVGGRNIGNNGPNAYEIKENIASLRSIIVKKLEEQIDEQLNVKNTQMYEGVRHALLPCSGLFRSILFSALVLELNAGWKNIENSMANIAPVAVAIELIQTMTLIQDDLPCMDNSLTRRGRESTHAKYGPGIAVLISDSLLVAAYSILASSSTIISFGDLVGIKGLATGQAMDLHADKPFMLCSASDLVVRALDPEGKLDEEANHYLKIIEAKTSLFFATVCRLAALWARPKGALTKELERILHEFGIFLGVAYQLQDDMEDAEEDGREYKVALDPVYLQRALAAAHKKLTEVNEKISKTGQNNGNMPYINYLMSRMFKKTTERNIDISAYINTNTN